MERLRTLVMCLVTVLVLVLTHNIVIAAEDLLPSWNDGAVRQSMPLYSAPIRHLRSSTPFPSRVSRKSREFRAKNKIPLTRKGPSRGTVINNAGYAGGQAFDYGNVLARFDR